MQCSICINPAVNYLENDTNIGFCDEHLLCSEENCDLNIKYRVYWDVNKFQLFRDTCENHAKPSSCHCSKDINSIKVSKFIEKK